MIQSVDESVAIINKALEDLRLTKKTIMIFFSDNGGHSTYTCQQPLRGGKGMFYEGGIRVPMFVYWPGMIKPGSSCHIPVSGIDFYPTFLKITGNEKPKDYTLDGYSILSLLKGEESINRETLFWHFPAYLESYKGLKEHSRDTVFRTRPVSVIRKGKWKLLMFHEEWVLDGGRENISENNSVELYNLENDLSESVNLSNIEAIKRDELLDELLQWQKTTSAPISTEPNPDFKQQE
jgi:arylsulfatase A-like enzyme